MSYAHISQLARVEEEYRAARLAVEYLEADWSRLHSLPLLANLSLAQVKRSSAGLETTYIIRLFSVFEAILRDYLPRRFPTHPDRRTVYELINKAASVHRVSLPVRDGVQAVRKFRNQAVHESRTEFNTLSFRIARASLNTFLSWLP